MGALRQSRSFNTDMGAGTGHHTTVVTGNTASYTPSVSQGLPTLIVMVVVLLIIVLFCFWGAPAVRDFCRRKICTCCPMDEPPTDNASIADGSATPTIILLPYGRMLVVDRSVFAQLQVDHTGIDFMELSANLIRAQRLHTGSNPSILESDATSKGLSPTSLDFLPPAYEEIFGTKNADLPPSYSEISVFFRNVSGPCSANSSVGSVYERNARNNDDNIEAGRMGGNNLRIMRNSSSAPFVLKMADCEFNYRLGAFRREFFNSENHFETHNREHEKEFNKNNDEMEETSSGSGLNQNVVSKRRYSGPKVGNCSTPENGDAKKKFNDGQNNLALSTSVQLLYSRNEGRNSNNLEEYVDRESSV